MQEIEVKATIAQIWADLLGVGEIVGTDDFFALGGDSILVTIVTLQVEEAIGVTVGADLIFDYPVLGDYCRAVVQATEANVPETAEGL